MTDPGYLPDRVSGPSALDTLASEGYGAAFPATAPPERAEQAAGTSAEENVDLSDAPQMVALTHMPFEARAEFMDGFAEVEPQLRELRDTGAGKGGSDTMRSAASMYRVLGRMEKLLRGAAADPQAWDAWPGRFDEHKLMALFGRYMEDFQAPEASSSSS